MGRTVLYARKSKKTQNEERDSVDSQLDELRRFARDKGWNNIVELTERGAPASAEADRVSRRKVFHGELVPMVDRGEVDRVLVVEPSRVSRHMATFIPFVDRVQVYFTRNGTDSKTSDPLRLALDAGLAAQESKIRSDRQRSHRKRMREAGRPRSGGYRKLGYDPDGTTVRPHEAKLLREAARRVTTGAALKAVTDYLNEAGLRAATGRELAPTSVRRQLMSSDLIDAQVREVVGAIFRDPARARGGFSRRSYLLSGGIIRCAECGERLISQAVYDPQTRAVTRRTYVCRTSTSDRTHGCGRVRVGADGIEDAVVSVLVDFTRLRGASEPTEDAAAIAAERAALSARRDEIADAFADGDLTRGQARRANERLDAAEAAIDERAGTLVADATPDLVDAPPRTEFDFWRAQMERRIERVVVSPDESASVYLVGGGGATIIDGVVDLAAGPMVEVQR